MQGLHKYKIWGFCGVENSYCGFLSYDIMQPGSWVSTFWRNILPEYGDNTFPCMLVPTSTKLQDVITQKTTIWRSVWNFWDSQNLGGNQKSITSVVNFCLNYRLVLEKLPDIRKNLLPPLLSTFNLKIKFNLNFGNVF
jgi:hypothetical protein